MKLTRQLLTIGLALLSSAVLASALPGRAEVKKVTGTATVSKGAGAATTLADGMVLGTGDIISTGPKSTVDLSLGLNGDVLRVEPDSTLALDQLDITRISPPVVNTKLNVTKGGVTANVITKLAAASRYEVRTPSGVAGIRGTVYNASVGTGLAVLHGAVSWTPAGGTVVNLSMGQTAGGVAAGVTSIGAALVTQIVNSSTASVGVVSPAQLANTVNTLAQSVATSAAIAVLAGGGTQAQAAAAASSAAQQVTAQVTTALTSIGLVALAPNAQTSVAAAAVGAATAVAASGGTAAQAAAAGATAANSAAAATGGTVTPAITAVANSAAVTTAAAVAGGATGAAAANASVTSSAVTTTQSVPTTAGTGGGGTVAAITTTVGDNPSDVSVAGKKQ